MTRINPRRLSSNPFLGMLEQIKFDAFGCFRLKTVVQSSETLPNVRATSIHLTTTLDLISFGIGQVGNLVIRKRSGRVQSWLPDLTQEVEGWRIKLCGSGSRLRHFPLATIYTQDVILLKLAFLIYKERFVFKSIRQSLSPREIVDEGCKGDVASLRE